MSSLAQGISEARIELPRVQPHSFLRMGFFLLLLRVDNVLKMNYIFSKGCRNRTSDFVKTVWTLPSRNSGGHALDFRITEHKFRQRTDCQILFQELSHGLTYLTCVCYKQ